MVCHHAMARPERPIRVLAGGLCTRQDNRAQRVGVVIVVLALQNSGEAFQPHAGINGRPRQRVTRAGGFFQELHEDQVPDFDEAIPILIRAARRAAENLVAMIEENLGTGAAGTGIPHAPEIIGCRDADDAIIADPSDLFPDVGSVFIF